MHLSLTAWSFPRLTLAEFAGVAKAIGMAAIDISSRHRTGIDKAEMLADPLLAASRVRARAAGQQLFPSLRRRSRRA